MMKVDLTVLILTYNEELHIRRAIESVRHIANEIIVVDSNSTDKTIQIAVELNARVLQNTFINQAQQVQWAIDHAGIQSKWTLRLDADEFLTPELQQEIVDRLPTLEQEITGVELTRRVFFMGSWIRFGGYYPIKLLRIWRTGLAAIEQRNMDEHTYLLKGKSMVFNNDFVDENLNNLAWWTEKHNTYSTREAIDILKQLPENNHDQVVESALTPNSQASQKRWMKKNLYLRLPLFLRAFLYFHYRYWIKLGVLDGKDAWSGSGGGAADYAHALLTFCGRSRRRLCWG